jgi:kynurenine formamidase
MNAQPTIYNLGRTSLDEVGALKAVTPELVRSALTLVKQGRVVNLAQLYSKDMPTIWFHGPFFYSTFRTPETCLKMFKDYTNKLGSMVCRYELSDHTGTHVDSLNHAAREYELYGGTDIRSILTDQGTERLGIDTMPPVVTRGVLFDVAGFLGKEILDEEFEITPKLIQEIAKKQSVEITPGDAVLFYTGYSNLWAKDNEKYLGSAPGLGVKAASWLASKKIGITGSDTSSFDVVRKKTKLLFPCHQVLIKDNGIHLVENLKLDELAKSKVTEFLFVCAPLKFKGGAGSPVAPIAVL